MAAIDFPNSPTIGQSFTSGGRTWIYSGVSWNSQSTSGLTSQVIVSETQPTTTVGGTQWFNTNNGKTYIYYDSYWVEESSGLPGPEGQIGLTGPRGIQGVPGETGPAGPAGPVNSISVGTVSASAPGSSPEVTITGTAPDQTINFVLPRGEKGSTGTQGEMGPANNLSIGFVVGGEVADATIAGTAPNQQLNLVLPKGDRGLDGLPGAPGEPGLVAATSPLSYDANTKTVSLSTQSLFSSPSLTGTPTAPTATAGTNTTQLATTQFVRSEIAAIVDSAPSTLDTLNELATALGDDPNFAATITTELGNKLNTSTYNTSAAPSTIFNVGNSGSGAYLIDGASNPTISLIRGQKYVFDVNATGHPFYIQTSDSGYTAGNVYASGITGAGTQVGQVVFEVPLDAPDTLYYVCQFHSSMRGKINISSLDAKAPLTQTVVGLSSAYTFTASDKGKFFYVGGTLTLTIPGNVFLAGDQIDVVNDAAGVITFSGSGLSIRSKDSKVTINKQYAGVTIKFLSPTVAYIVGDLA